MKLKNAPSPGENLTDPYRIIKIKFLIYRSSYIISFRKVLANIDASS